MDDLLLRFLRGGTTQAEADTVHAWLRESPDNEAHLRAMGEILALARARDGRTDPGEPPVAADLIKQAGTSRPPSKIVHPLRPPAWAIAPLAVAATAAFVALGLLGYGRWSGGEDEVRLAAEELVTGAGESTTVRMSDGSVVRLGPESRLQVMPDGSGRQVVLVGRAFFAVTPDETRPFRVHTPSGSIRVLGTRFQLEAGVEDMRLVVVEGSVALAASGSEVEVRAGEMTEVRSGRTGSVQKAPGLAELSSEWMGQFLVFQRTPLTKAAKEIEEIYGVEVRILDANLGEKTLTMWFTSRPLEDVLTVVCNVIDASCGIEGGLVSIAARSH
jgi:transmembrane sensor